MYEDDLEDPEDWEEPLEMDDDSDDDPRLKGDNDGYDELDDYQKDDLKNKENDE